MHLPVEFTWRSKHSPRAHFFHRCHFRSCWDQLRCNHTLKLNYTSLILLAFLLDRLDNVALFKNERVHHNQASGYYGGSSRKKNGSGIECRRGVARSRVWGCRGQSQRHAITTITESYDFNDGKGESAASWGRSHASDSHKNRFHAHTEYAPWQLPRPEKILSAIDPHYATTTHGKRRCSSAHSCAPKKSPWHPHALLRSLLANPRDAPRMRRPRCADTTPTR